MRPASQPRIHKYCRFLCAWRLCQDALYIQASTSFLLCLPRLSYLQSLSLHCWTCTDGSSGEHAEQSDFPACIHSTCPQSRALFAQRGIVEGLVFSYIPEENAKLLSLGQLSEQGVDIKSTGAKMYIHREEKTVMTSFKN